MKIETFITAKADKAFSQEDLLNLAYDNAKTTVEVQSLLECAGFQRVDRPSSTARFFIERRSAIAKANNLTRITSQQHRAERFGEKGRTRYLVHNIVEDLWMDAVNRVVVDPRGRDEAILAGERDIETIPDL